MITLGTKEEQEEAYWEGFIIGSTPPGYPGMWGIEIDDRSRHSWERSEFDVETPEDKAYWAGVASGAMVSGSILSGGVYIATAGESMSFIGGSSLVTFEILKALVEPAASVLRFTARNLPLVGLLYFMLSGGGAIGEGIREQQRIDSIVNIPYGGQY